MTDNDPLLEIHRVREKVVQECDCDVHKIGEPPRAAREGNRPK